MFYQFVYYIYIQKCLSANVVICMTDRCYDANKININNSKHNDGSPVLFQSHPYIEISIHLGIKCNIYALIPHAASVVWCWYCLPTNCHVHGIVVEVIKAVFFYEHPCPLCSKCGTHYGSQKEPYSVQFKLSSQLDQSSQSTCTIHFQYTALTLTVDLMFEAARLGSTLSQFFWLDINIFWDYYALDSSICLKLFRSHLLHILSTK